MIHINYWNTMDPSTLKTFITVAKEKSFSKTAEKMHITQPAVSKRFSNLVQSL